MRDQFLISFSALLPLMKKLIKVGVILLSIFMIIMVYYWGRYSFGVHWHGHVHFNIPISKAVDRALILNGNHKQYPIILHYETPTICTAEELSEGGLEVYKSCWVSSAAKLDHCGSILYDPSCRAIKVPKKIWEHQDLRERIISAALNPCEYHFSYEETEKLLDRMRNGIPQKKLYNNYGSTHGSLWYRAGCAKEPVNRIYIEICEMSASSSFRNCDVVDVYKATL